MSVNCTSLGKRISFYRSKSNLSQEALAAKINCSREHIVRIENGTKIPSISVLVEIANTLSVSADELLLDCLEHSSSSANSEFHRLLLDCNETEQTVIIRIRTDRTCHKCKSLPGYPPAPWVCPLPLQFYRYCDTPAAQNSKQGSCCPLCGRSTAPW